MSPPVSKTSIQTKEQQQAICEWLPSEERASCLEGVRFSHMSREEFRREALLRMVAAAAVPGVAAVVTVAPTTPWVVSILTRLGLVGAAVGNAPKGLQPNDIVGKMTPEEILRRAPEVLRVLTRSFIDVKHNLTRDMREIEKGLLELKELNPEIVRQYHSKLLLVNQSIERTRQSLSGFLYERVLVGALGRDKVYALTQGIADIVPPSPYANTPVYRQYLAGIREHFEKAAFDQLSLLCYRAQAPLLALQQRARYLLDQLKAPEKVATRIELPQMNLNEFLPDLQSAVRSSNGAYVKDLRYHLARIATRKAELLPTK